MTDLQGKHGLIVGVANKRSIAWAIAEAAARAGARLAVTYQGERLEENVRELSAALSDPLIVPCDVTDDHQIADVFQRIERRIRRSRLRRPWRRVRAARRARRRLPVRADVACRLRA